MRELAILEFQSLDGVMQAPSDPDEDRSGDFGAGGWARCCWEEVIAQVVPNAMSEPYDLLLGRKTYDLFAQSFSDFEPDNPVATMLNAARKYVVTSDAESLAWNNSRAVSNDAIEQIRELKTEKGRLLQVHGSWQLVQSLIQHDLVDEYRIWTFPVVVGTGKRLFEQGAPPSNLRMVKSDVCPSGATMGIYRRLEK